MGRKTRGVQGETLLDQSLATSAPFSLRPEPLLYSAFRFGRRDDLSTQSVGCRGNPSALRFGSFRFRSQPSPSPVSCHLNLCGSAATPSLPPEAPGALFSSFSTE